MFNSMKKLVLIGILIAGIVFISGCTGGERATDSKTTIDSQTNPKSEVQQISELIIKQSDVPGLTLEDFSFLAVPKSSETSYDGNAKFVPFSYETVRYQNYKDSLPIGTRKVGESSNYVDNAGRQIEVKYEKYDSTSNFSMVGNPYSPSVLKSSKERGAIIDYGDPKIGDFSVWIEGERDPNVHVTSLVYTYKTYIVSLRVVDDKDKSRNEALRIAELIKDRLD
ncbi:hypothetical protein ig2599ANME_0549 [groundwater metagenome]